jgi:hypothetical protein
MEFINETSYDEEDLKTLWLLVRKQVAKDKSASGYYSSPSLPKRLRIGYYTPTLSEEGDEPRFKHYARLTSRRNYRTIPRLAIVRRKLFPLSPLEHLAMTAADEMVVPAEVVSDIAGAIAEWHGGERDDPSGSDWEWTLEFKLRFKLRIRRGSLEAATRDRKKLKLDRLYQRAYEARRSKERMEKLLKERSAEIADLEEMIEALRKEIER